jgi:hypothetical protein
MATIASTSVVALDAQKNIREDLGNVIFNVTPFMTPFTSGISQARATADTHEWLTDTYEDAIDTNARVEAGLPQTSTAGTTRVRLGNFIQIADKTVTVTKKAEFMDRAGIPGKEMAYQLMKLGKELQMDVEKQTLGCYGAVSTKFQGTAGAAGVSGAFGSYLVTNQQNGGVAGAVANPGNAAGVGDGSTVPTVGGVTAAIEQARMDSLLDGVWNNSGDINSAKIMASAGTVSSLRNTLIGMADNVDSNLNANSTSGGNIISRVAVYVSQFGPIAVVPNKHMPANTLYVVDYSTWGLAFAGGKKIHSTDIATQTSAEQKLLECYYTLEARSEEANAAYYNIA